MRYIAFDMGTKRIGVAYSDESGTFAFPEAVIPNDSGLFGAIFDICSKYKPDGLVVGYSDSGVSVQNPIQKHVDRFIAELESRFGIPVYIMNESGTSHSVRLMNSSLMGQKHNQATKRAVLENAIVDASAAALILQRYLDSNKTSVY